MITKNSNANSTRKRVTLLIFVLIKSFILCWFPFHAWHLIKVDWI